MTDMNNPDLDRRQVLGLLGSSAAASIGITGTADGQEGLVVSMGDNYFDPIGLSVEPGTVVRFEIETGSHSATAYKDRIPSEAIPFDSGTISQGAFEYTFETPGTYDYYCIPHESMGMVGRIVVGEPGGPAEESPIPEGEVPDSEVIVEQRTVTIDEFDGADDEGSSRMMGSGSRMMDGHRSDWMMLMPIGFITTLLGFGGGIGYWISQKANTESSSGDSAITSLREQYGRGEIDEEGFHQRRNQLEERE